MSLTLGFLIWAYILVALGFAMGVTPRSMFKHPIERFIARASCGLLWPMMCGYLLGGKLTEVTTDSNFKEQG